jgi:hypothetical protein
MSDSNRSSRRKKHPFDEYFKTDKDPSDKSPLETPANAPDYCAFCLGSLKGKDFRAYSKVIPASAICCDCIRLYALVARFSCDTSSIWFRANPDYEPLRRSILRRFFATSGSVRMKKVIAGLAIRVLQRSTAVMMGETKICRRTGVDLQPIRVALTGVDVEECGIMLKIASDEIGVCFSECTKKEMSSGVAYARLVQYIHGEKRWAELGILMCRGFAPATNTDCAVIYACRATEELPDEVEVIELD